MKQFFIATLLLISLVAGQAAAPSSTVPISAMPVTTNVSDSAYFPLIQPYPGRTTNDNFRATTASIFTGRGTGTFTNIYVTNLFVTNLIMLAGTNVASVNPTIGRIPYKDTTNTFGDSALFFIDTNTVGAVEMDTSTIGVSNLVTGGFVISVDSGFGYGILTNAPFSNFTLWTNNTSVLEPIDLTLQPLVNIGWFVGTNSPANYGGPLAGEALVAYSVVANGDPERRSVELGSSLTSNFNDASATMSLGALTNRSFLSLGATSNSSPWSISINNDFLGGVSDFQMTVDGVSRAEISPTKADGQPVVEFDSAITHATGNLLTVGNNSTNQFTIAAITGIGAADGSKFFANDGTFHSSSGAGTTINATDTYLPARLNATTFTNSPLYTVGGTNTALDGQLYLGPGTTSVIQHASSLIFTNSATGATDGGFEAINGNGQRALFTSSGNLAIVRGEGGVSIYDSIIAGNELRWFGNRLWNIQADTILGGDFNSNPHFPFGIVNQNTNRVVGYFDTTVTNLSYGALYHGGTNDFFRIASIGGGIAGSAKPTLFTVGTSGSQTNMMQIDGTSGASTTGILIYENGTAQRVSIGANDSGGAGFRVLRIPN